MKTLSKTCVRGPILHFIIENVSLLGSDIIEIGSRVTHPDAWWMDNRQHAPESKWFGIDVEAGPNVDLVWDATTPFIDKVPNKFTGAICSEVLEHCREPVVLLKNLLAVMAPGAKLLVTVPCSFHEHFYPDDYWRFMPSGLKVVLEEAGWIVNKSFGAGLYKMSINDHDEARMTEVTMYRHSFAIATAP